MATPSGSLACEFRFAFLGEGGEALFGVVGLKALDVGGGVGEEGGFGLGAFVLMDEAFGFAQRDGRRGQKCVDEFLSFGHESHRRDDGVDESEFEGLFGVDGFAGDAQFEGARFADERGELREAVAWGPTEQDFGHAEAGRL